MFASTSRRRRSGFSSGRYLEWYVEEPLVDQNPFPDRTADGERIPGFDLAAMLLPQPFWPSNPLAIEAYWNAWALAWSNLRQPTEANGFVANYIDTAFNDCLFLWDSAFILQFGRYGDRAFPFQRTLDNLYASQHPDGFVCREIRTGDGTDQWHRACPFGTGPNVLAWSEWEHFQNHGNLDRLADVLPGLLAYHRWTRRNRTWPDGSYWTTGLGSGMDNMPRVPAGADPGKEPAGMVWVDATFQAILSARLLAKMGFLLGRRDLVAECEEAERLTVYANENLWDDRTGFYYDRFADGALSRIKSVAPYWSLLARAVPADRQIPFVSHLDDPASFNRYHRVPTLAADAPGYDPETGDYWRGGVWAPTTYMVLRGLTATGEDDLADAIAANHHARVLEVFQRTGTFWENYSPERPTPGHPARADFVGWSGLPPIAVLIEYRFGLRPIDPLAGRLLWDVRLTDEFGIENYPLGPTATLSLHCAARKSAREEPRVRIESSEPVEVEVRWATGRKVLRA